ncbi:MAG: S8 family peptidase, partial [Pirellulaceae bacterium]|nr:S8 family peptidase [Pirellulaceae bacterium]
FAGAIAERILTRGQPAPGADVIKRGSAHDETSGSATPILTLNLVVDSADGPDPQGGDPNQNRVVRADDQGEFQITLRPDERLVEILPGDPGVAEDPDKHQTFLSDLGPTEEELQRLSPEQLTQLATYNRTVYSLTQIQDSQSPSARFLVPYVLFGDAAGGVPVIFQNGGLLEVFERAEIALEDEVLSDVALGAPAPRDVVVTSPKAEQVAIVTRKIATAAELDELQTQIGQVVRQIAGDDAGVAVTAGQSRDLPLPDSLGGDATVQTWRIQVRGPDGTPLALNKQDLQEALTQTLGNHPVVRSAEVAAPRIGTADAVDDPLFHSKGTWGEDFHDQWALRRVGFRDGADNLWPTDLDKVKTCTVAVIGSGVDWTHPELLGQMWVNSGEDPYNGVDDDGNGFVDDQFGWNFREDNAAVIDRGGHDTHISGVIAARTGNGRGIAGVTPTARIMALKVANYRAQANSVDISSAILYAVDNGARVINISYGGDQPAAIEQRAIDYAVTKGVLVVVAAGNKGKDAQQQALVSCRGVLTVAGTTTEDKRATFSNWGRPVDLAAPAMDILGLRARRTDFLLYLGEGDEESQYRNGAGIVGKSRQYYRASGTSFAAPLVSGVAALLFSTQPQLSAEQVRRMLIMSADDIEGPGWDLYTGAGILNAAAALKADPKHFLFARVSEIKAVRRDGKIQVDVFGQAEGSQFIERRLQFAFGATPQDDAWRTVSTSKRPQPGGVLGSIPTEVFNRRGTWSVRILSLEKGAAVREGRATLNIQ